MLKPVLIFAALFCAVFCTSRVEAQTAVLSGRVLTITARNGFSERFVIKPGGSPNNFGQIQNIVVVMPNGSQPQFRLNAVDTIVFNGGSGDDTCIIQPNSDGLKLAAARSRWTNLAPLSVEMFGRGGNDTLTGSDTDDQIVGGSGVDNLDAGSKGDDEIRGGTNGDRFHVYYHWANLNGFPYPLIHSTFPADYSPASGDRLVYHYEFYLSPNFRFRF